MNPNVYASIVQKDISLIEKEKVILVGINQGIDEKYYYEISILYSSPNFLITSPNMALPLEQNNG